MTTGVVWEELYTRHNMGAYHPESPARLLAIKEVIEDAGIAKHLTRLKPRPATKKEIGWVHDADYINEIEATAGRSVVLDPDTSTSPETWDAACLAAGGAIACVEYVMGDPTPSLPLLRGGSSKGAFAFVRPPGHHAEHNHAMGFCIFNNIAIAAEYAIRKHGLKKVAILDFDVHHGNGTQHHFYERDDVFFASTHRRPFYPGTGGRDEAGSGKGAGLTLNVPLPGGIGDQEWREAWKGQIVPRVRDFSPELILVSAGFDAHEDDPLGGMHVTTDGYRWLASELVSLADKVNGGRIVFVLEGGYSLTALKSCVKAVLEEMI